MLLGDWMKSLKSVGLIGRWGEDRGLQAFVGNLSEKINFEGIGIGKMKLLKLTGK
jgi:hypothetical protein